MRPAVMLAELNTIDLTVDAITARLAQINDALREPEALRTARSRLAEAEAELARWQIAEQQRETSHRQASDKVSNSEQQLYGGKVRSPKELADLQRDQQQLRRQQGQSEDELLEALVGVETATARVAECQADLNRQVQEWDAAQTQLRTEQAQLKTRLAAEQARQAAARRAVPARLLPVYDSLRARCAGCVPSPNWTATLAPLALWPHPRPRSKLLATATSWSIVRTAAGCCGASER